MSGFINVLDQLIEYGATPFVDPSHSLLKLKQRITQLYLEYLKIAHKDVGYEDHKLLPKFDFQEIRKVLLKNFPQLNEQHYGHEIDDITNLILFAKTSKWRYNEIGEKDAMAYFQGVMLNTGEEKVVDVLKFLSDQ